jgi:nucleotidyltransferase substrate binding protein (TIGR01987 family)
MNKKEVRWKQRFENFEKSFSLLNKYISLKNTSEIERAGIIQFFEMTFELSWKLLKDYLEANGYIVKSPRDSIKQAFQAEIIENGHVWLDALEDRNLTVHTYDEATAVEVEKKIREQYYPMLLNLYNFMKEKRRQ